MKTPIRTAIVGLGRAGWFLHLEPISTNSQFQLVAITDADSQRVREGELKTQARGYSSLESLLEEEELDLVVIASPSLLHASQARLVLEAGCHCVLEKPMASSYAEAVELAEIAQQRNLHIFVHHQHVFGNEFNYLREVWDSGILGPIFHFSVSWARYNRRWDWQTLRSHGGGQLNNTCPHLLSILLPLLNSPVSCTYASLRNIKDAGDCEDHAHIVLESESGITCDITISAASALPGTRWLLVGKYGALQSDGEHAHLRYFSPIGLPQQTVCEGAAPGRLYETETLPWEERHESVRPHQVPPSFYENVAAVLQDNQSPIVSLESALSTLRVIDLIRERASIQSGGANGHS